MCTLCVVHRVCVGSLCVLCVMCRGFDDDSLCVLSCAAQQVDDDSLCALCVLCSGQDEGEGQAVGVLRGESGRR